MGTDKNNKLKLNPNYQTLVAKQMHSSLVNVYINMYAFFKSKTLINNLISVGKVVLNKVIKVYNLR